MNINNTLNECHICKEYLSNIGLNLITSCNHFAHVNCANNDKLNKNQCFHCNELNISCFIFKLDNFQQLAGLTPYQYEININQSSYNHLFIQEEEEEEENNNNNEIKLNLSHVKQQHCETLMSLYNEQDLLNYIHQIKITLKTNLTLIINYLINVQQNNGEKQHIAIILEQYYQLLKLFSKDFALRINTFKKQYNQCEEWIKAVSNFKFYKLLTKILKYQSWFNIGWQFRFYNVILNFGIGDHSIILNGNHFMEKFYKLFSMYLNFLTSNSGYNLKYLSTSK